jgi:hypothetical protein
VCSVDSVSGSVAFTNHLLVYIQYFIAAFANIVSVRKQAIAILFDVIESFSITAQDTSHHA